MTRNRKFALGAFLLVSSIAYLVYAGVQQGAVYYFTIDEFAARKGELIDQGVRVAGRVQAGSVEKRTDERGTELKFTMGDFADGAPAPGAAVLPVHFAGIVPDMFAEGRDVIVEGRFDGGVLQAQSVLTSCPSKYEADGAQQAAKPDGSTAVD
jgi:cytochrome c-type biogenesis protein CcmE